MTTVVLAGWQVIGFAKLVELQPLHMAVCLWPNMINIQSQYVKEGYLFNRKKSYMICWQKLMSRCDRIRNFSRFVMT